MSAKPEKHKRRQQEAQAQLEAEAKSKDKSKAKGKEDTKGGKSVQKAQSKKKAPEKGKNGRKPGNKKPNIFKRFANYLHAVRLELKRVSWPNGREVRNRTLTVLFALVFFGLLIYLVDTGINPLLLAYSNLSNLIG